VLHLDLNSETLSGTLKTLQSAYDGSADASFVDYDLGFPGEEGRLDKTDAENHISEQYWAAVSARIRELVRSLQRAYMPHVTELLLTGPFATNKRSQEAIRAALQDHGIDESVLASLEQHDVGLAFQDECRSFFNFATARGAAEIAKRRQEGPVQCAQGYECRRRREGVHDAQDSDC
jgi:hypothetical protein